MENNDGWMRGWRIPSVRAVLLLATAMVTAVAISSGILLIDLRQKELAHARSEAVGLTGILSEQTTRAFDGVALMLHAVGERMSDNYGRHLQLDSLPIRLLLKARSAGLPQVKSIFLVDQHGYGVNSSREDFIKLLPMQNREFYRYHAAGGNDAVFFSQPEIARIDRQWTGYVSVALHDESGRFRGVLVAALNLDYFESLYSSIRFDAVSQIVLLNREGLLLAGQPRGEMAIGEIFAAPEKLAKLEGRAERSQVEPLPDGNVSGKRHAAYRAVAKYPLYIAASFDEAEALEPWRSIAQPIIAGVVGVIAFVLAMTWFIARNLIRKEALEGALIDSGEQLRDMVESVKDAIVTLDATGKVLTFNQAAVTLFGIGSSRAVGLPLAEALEPALGKPQSTLLAEILGAERRGEDGTGLLDLKIGEREVSVEFSLSRIRFRGATRVTAIFRDTTERRRAEQALRESNRQLHELSASMESIREAERTRIARELHDELGQSLTAMRMEISWLSGRLLPEQDLLRDRAATIKTQIDHTIGSVRRISSELRPLVLDDLGFNAAATWYVDQFSERTRLPVELTLPERDPERGSSEATALFRIMQESMTNVARHAEARQVCIRLRADGGHWELTIHDDGKGFSHDPGVRSDIGLLGMRERAQMLGGRLTIESAPGKGTTITAILPNSRH